VLISPKGFVINLLFMFPKCHSYDDRQTRPIQRDEKIWKEGERMKEK
jgi:hypothetical protein